MSCYPLEKKLNADNADDTDYRGFNPLNPFHLWSIKNKSREKKYKEN